VVHILILEIIVMATVTKAVLATQNSALRAELSQLKGDLATAQASIDSLVKASWKASREASTKPAPVALTRAQLMASAKQLAMKTGQVTQIRDDRVEVKSNGQWVAA
jgi:cell division septum initiation protein DivIVA